jgi:predicted pyridoxine 5'-phosphate oxidase superfamily flavin-nucleotide-binding protein
MTTADLPGVWHRGELEAQRRAGVDPAHTAKVTPFLRPFLNEQHRAFYPLLPFVVVGAVDDTGGPWATILEGPRGFLQAPDDRHLHIAAHPQPGDPARAGLAEGRAVGLLGIELATRRRNRLSGRVAHAGEDGLEIAVDRAYGNCPRFITTRELAWTMPVPAVPEERTGLDDEARATIAAASTLFVASSADVEAGGVDVSHRGGRPGFVAVDGDTLLVPDFDGNQFFNTIGNFVVNPRAGLLFADFERGDVLQLTGRVELLLDGAPFAGFEGAPRGWRVRVERLVRRRGALGWRGRVLEASPFSATTGTWAEARAASGRP